MDDKVKFGAMVVAAYVAYMLCTWPNSPDGILLSGVIGALCVLAGVKYGQNKAEGIRVEANEGPEEPL